MNRCDYCGCDCEDGAGWCPGCGGAVWKKPGPVRTDVALSKRRLELPSKRPLESKPPPAPVVQKGSMTLINCRTADEAKLMVKQLEAAEIIAVLSTEENRDVEFGEYGFIRFQVSTKAYQAAAEVHDSIEYDAAAVAARSPLGRAEKFVAFFLPLPFPVGFIVFVTTAYDFSNQGFRRRADEWAKWFACGLVVWSAVLAVWFARR